MYLIATSNSSSLQTWLDELKEFQLDSMFDTNVLGRAYLYTQTISFSKKEATRITAIIGKARRYEIHLSSMDGEIKGECSCPFEGKCKHLAALIIKMIE